MNIQELRQNNIAINTVRDENYKNATFFPLYFFKTNIS